MSTFIVNANDTIFVSDSISTLAVKMPRVCQHIVAGSPTNCEDVMIAAIIGVVIVIVAWISKTAILSWKDIVRKTQENERTDYRTKEENESKRKQDADRENRKNMIEDEERKQKVNLLDKYIELIKKESEKGACETSKYRETLAHLIELSQKGQLSEITEVNLNAIFKKECNEEESK